MSHHLLVLTIACFLCLGCTSKQSADDNPQSRSPQAPSESISLVFLTRDGCANTPVLLANLKAVTESFDQRVDFEILDQGALPRTDARVGYATPTILYQNLDLFGLPRPVPPFPEPS